ncbi:hypothetical protein QC761_0063230 [Podospora bellae-mahoneyi]|uniref:Uncharacterized protein n=1 Tax=Podospora bellae-mahoneyi TaxID=2093777 RepID=A0ABR0FGR7_9PEZI|nr:hypothetical protein QC761_0063230 [Podospora bellae-mahoneyi]
MKKHMLRRSRHFPPTLILRYGCIRPSSTSLKMSTALVCDFKHLARGDVALVGGKISSLGEMISRLASQGIPVPPGLLAEWQAGRETLAKTGRAVRRLFIRGEWPADAGPPSPPPTRSSQPRLGLITCLLPSGLARRLRIFLTLALPASESRT